MSDKRMCERTEYYDRRQRRGLAANNRNAVSTSGSSGYLTVLPKSEAVAPQPEATPLCPKCKEPFGDSGDWEGVCIDCWPGYNLCKECEDYRCEHIVPTEEDLKDPEFTSCHCGNKKCRTGFVEGSSQRIVNRKEWEAIKKSWEPAATTSEAMTAEQFWEDGEFELDNWLLDWGKLKDVFAFAEAYALQVRQESEHTRQQAEIEKVEAQRWVERLRKELAEARDKALDEAHSVALKTWKSVPRATIITVADAILALKGDGR